MGSVIGAVIGFAGAIFPEIFRMLQDKNDKLHELKIMQLQMENRKNEHTDRLAEINTKADIAEISAIYKTYNTGIKWVDSLNGTVRPVLAYCFFLLYASVKCMQFSIIGDSDLAALWDSEDQVIFASIISFYFGQRALIKARK
jgi:hypothetical protein